jgi:hypothetical protein
MNDITYTFIYSKQLQTLLQSLCCCKQLYQRKEMKQVRRKIKLNKRKPQNRNTHTDLPNALLLGCSSTGSRLFSLALSSLLLVQASFNFLYICKYKQVNIGSNE